MKFLFILLFVTFPLGQIARVEWGGGVTILLNDVIVFAVVAVWFLQKLLQRKPFERYELTIPIFFFACMALLSLLVNAHRFAPNEFIASSLYLVRWVVYAGLYFVVCDFKKEFRQKLLTWLLFAGSATALLGFLQYLLYPNLRNLYYAGWDEHLYRLFSTFLDPNFAGGIFVLTFLAGVALVRIERGPLTKLLYVFVAMSSLGALLLTYSRGSFVSFVTGTIMFFWLVGKKKLIFFSLLLFGFGLGFLPKDLQSEGVKLFRTASIEARLTEAAEAITIFQENPLFGVGFNTYRYAKAKKGFATTNEFGEIHSAAGTDNSFLFVLATTGIAGFLAYCYLWFSTIRVTWSNPLILASLLAIFVHALFVNSLFYPHIMEWLWILIGITGSSKVGRLL